MPAIPPVAIVISTSDSSSDGASDDSDDEDASDSCGSAAAVKLDSSVGENAQNLSNISLEDSVEERPPANVSMTAGKGKCNTPIVISNVLH